MPALLNYRNTIISAVVCLDLVLFLRLVLISASFPWLCLKVYFCCSVELEQISTVWKVIKNWDDWRRNKGFNCVPSAAQVGFYHLDHQFLTLVCNAGLLRALALSLSPMRRQVLCQCHTTWQKLALGAQDATWDNKLLPQQTHISCGVGTSFMQVEHVLKLLDLMLCSCLPEQWHQSATQSCLLRGRKSQYNPCQTVWAHQLMTWAPDSFQKLIGYGVA